MALIRYGLGTLTGLERLRGSRLEGREYFRAQLRLPGTRTAQRHEAPFPDSSKCPSCKTLSTFRYAVCGGKFRPRTGTESGPEPILGRKTAEPMFLAR